MMVIIKKAVILIINDNASNDDDDDNDDKVKLAFSLPLARTCAIRVDVDQTLARNFLVIV